MIEDGFDRANSKHRELVGVFQRVECEHDHMTVVQDRPHCGFIHRRIDP
jgi:hypothetical protein